MNDDSINYGSERRTHTFSLSWVAVAGPITGSRRITMQIIALVFVSRIPTFAPENQGPYENSLEAINMARGERMENIMKMVEITIKGIKNGKEKHRRWARAAAMRAVLDLCSLALYFIFRVYQKREQEREREEEKHKTHSIDFCFCRIVRRDLCRGVIHICIALNALEALLVSPVPLVKY